jgi:ABC-type lipoprotein release transport system permease subunit
VILQADIVKAFGATYQFILPEDAANIIRSIYRLTFFTLFFVAFLLLMMVYLCSSFLVSLSIETRRQEIGIYQAMGVRKWRIALLFGGEFLLAMFIFGAIGIALGIYTMAGVSRTGIEATIIPLHLIFGRSVLLIQNHPETFLLIIGILIVAFAGNVLNAVTKLNKLDPVEVMREL